MDLLAQLTQEIQAFLSAAHIFRAHSKQITRGMGGEYSHIAEIIREKEIYFFDNFISYGLCYNLRNHALHHYVPFSSTEVFCNKVDNSEHIKIYIDKSILIKNKKLSRSFLKRLKDIQETHLELYPYLQDYFIMHAEMFRLVLKILEVPLNDARKILSDLNKIHGKRVRGVVGTTVCDSLVASEKDFTMYSIHFMEQIDKEIRYLKRLFKKFDFNKSV